MDKNTQLKRLASHYASLDGSTTVQDVIEAFGMNWNRGNAIKYLIRAGRKDPDKELDDLRKALSYIEYEIARLEKE